MSIIALFSVMLLMPAAVHASTSVFYVNVLRQRRNNGVVTLDGNPNRHHGASLNHHHNLIQIEPKGKKQVPKFFEQELKSEQYFNELMRQRSASWDGD